MDIFNREFRDVAAAGTYPFTGGSTMAYGRVHLNPALFLDAVVYPYGSFTLPFYVSRLSAEDGDGSVRVTVSDALRQEIGTATCTQDFDSALIVDQRNSAVGSLTYNPALLQDLAGELQSTFLNLPQNMAELVASTCFRMESEGLIHVDASAGSVTGDVNIVAANGMMFSVDEDSVVHVHLYGEEPFNTPPISEILIVNDAIDDCCEEELSAPASVSMKSPTPSLFAYPGNGSAVSFNPGAAVRVLVADSQIEISKLEDF